MKRINLNNLDEQDFVEAAEEYAGFCDVKANPEDVLEEVDQLLADYGLEVVIADTGNPDTLFTIIKRKKGKHNA